MLGKDKKFLKGAANKKLAYELSVIHTLEDANKQLEKDLSPIFLLIAKKITVELNDNQLSALASFCYNCGSSSTLFNLINKKDKKIYDW